MFVGCVDLEIVSVLTSVVLLGVGPMLVSVRWRELMVGCRWYLGLCVWGADGFIGCGRTFD